MGTEWGVSGPFLRISREASGAPLGESLAQE